MRVRQIVAALVLLTVAEAAAQKKTVVVLEYRAGAKGAAGIGDRLAKLLASNAAFTVIDPQEARRRAGAKIDAEVARCSGDAMCVGSIGERIGAQEVLLVGVSMLGDVVIALQRIDAKRGESGARLSESIPPDAELGDDELLRWLKQLYPPEAFRRYGSIDVRADVDGAHVLLNGEGQGKTPLVMPLQVRAPASYQVKVQKSGHVPFQAKIDVLPDATVEVRATLPRDEGRVPWFKRWYVWAAVGGALAVAGAGVAIYYGTRVEETPLGFIRLPTAGDPLMGPSTF